MAGRFATSLNRGESARWCVVEEEKAKGAPRLTRSDRFALVSYRVSVIAVTKPLEVAI
jgi:hypothetical protein